jgi:hypothetical protein
MILKNIRKLLAVVVTHKARILLLTDQGAGSSVWSLRANRFIQKCRKFERAD